MVNVSNLEFRYGKIPVLTNLNLSLEEGNIYGLLGKNGVGKSTLLKLLCGLLRPTDGDISILGYSPIERKPDFLKDIYFLPEDFISPKLSPMEYSSIYSPLYPTYDHGLFCALLKQFEVEPDMKLTKLSFGQQKKAELEKAMEELKGEEL